MKKLHTFAFYALVTPAMTLSSGALLAEQSSGQDGAKNQQQSTQHDPSQLESPDKTAQTEQKMGDQQKMASQSDMQNRGFLDSVPENGMQASKLIGSEVQTTGDEEVGSVSELIIDKDGQVMAIVVGVGGFLGMGEKAVAIGWDDIKKTGTAENQELRIDKTRDELMSAPEFESQE